MAIDSTNRNVATQILETGGPTTLNILGIPDGEFVKRSGSTLIGSAVTGGSGGVGGIVIAFRNPASNAQYLTVPSNAAFNIGSPSKFTVRMWIMPLTSNTNNGIATRGDLANTQGDWALGFFNGSTMRPTFRVNNNGASIQSSTDLTIGRWYFIEASYDSSLGSNNLKLFIDGVLDVQGNYTTVITNNSNPIRVGTYFSGSNCFVGYISEFEYCAGVVRNTSSYTPTAQLTPDASTTIHLSLNEYHAAGVTDDSGNGFNGATAGTPSGLLETAFRKL